MSIELASPPKHPGDPAQNIASGKLYVLLAQPGAGYVAAPTITLPANVGASCRALDTNRDGKQDLVCPYSETFNASLATFLGSGDGTLRTSDVHNFANRRR